MESLCCFTHVLFLSNRYEITQMPEFHHKHTIPCRYTKVPTKYDANVHRRASLECASIEERAPGAPLRRERICLSRQSLRPSGP
jgi:hypothetical protein